MSQSTPLAYATLSRPSRDSATIHRSAARASAAHQQQAQQSPSLARATDGAAYTAGGIADVSLSSLDTWTGFLSSQWAEAVKAQSLMPSNAAPVNPPSGADLISSLHSVVSRQNKVVAQLQERLVAQRTKEEKDWEAKKQLSRSTSAEGVPDSASNTKGEAVASVDDSVADSAAENTQVCVLLSHLLEHARFLWARAVSQHFKVAEVRKSSAGKDTRSPRKATAGINAEAAMEEERVGLPPISLLFRCLVDGINSEEAQQAIVTAGVLPASAWDSGVLGVDQLGILTVFERHVQALRIFPSIVPPLEALREYFAELHPQQLSKYHPRGALDSTLELAEAQTDVFLRFGDETEQMAALLREGLHPSVRRFLYARALQVPLAVTDGKPMFLAQGEFMTNHLRHGLARYLTCSSRQARERVKRRFHHHYLSSKEENRARLLQRLALDDMFVSVGDSDKYFVYTDDVEVLSTAMVVDRSLPDPKMVHALKQLGRPGAQLDSYVTYLQYPEKNLIHQKALPCGVAPLEGFTFLLGALCNVTSDTVEQYELAAAIMTQLWGRLQGPTPELFQCCLLFESLVQQLALPAVLHATRDLQYPPLVLAMRWMLTGFADLLDAFEVLSFWDLVLSYHMREMHRRSPLSLPTGLANAAPHDTSTPCALWLLPMYAAAIFVMRAPLVEACRTASEVDVVFATGHQLRTRSLLQGLLFG
ncbi:conserved hypothetical protein [Leishmania mexicana MHOM/GT/2001/U1103]|uniref:Rab-GAP TBC domain-containing protein n=1 Tax=Leishmania mexicana (strain MHOM/GT/2001/U1103) TaxID=929439 RepID=E9AQC9_LEIMU|nr:conserved hypothetical protein [Leishmania mexicana MHOM/GT/2001/U1103]CBZ25148.1 conserved hypothetical protein [Leishmania mexicana MHOM/GT/2001/U1103]